MKSKNEFYNKLYGIHDYKEDEIIIKFEKNENYDYFEIEKETYQKALVEIQNSSNPSHNGIIRPLNFKETITAKIENENFKKSYSTCSAILYKVNSTRFKIINICDELINIQSNFVDSKYDINYNLINSEEFDSKKIKMNENLNLEEILKHPVYLHLLENDSELLEKYVNNIINKFPNKPIMRFGINLYPNEDYLRAITINESDVFGNYALDSKTTFIVKKIKF